MTSGAAGTACAAPRWAGPVLRELAEGACAGLCSAQRPRCFIGPHAC